MLEEGLADLDEHKNVTYACMRFSAGTAGVVLRLKASLGGITVVLSLLAIVLIFISKKYKDFTFRLVIYLMMIDIFQAMAMCLALGPITISGSGSEKHAVVKTGTGWEDFCEVTGFLLMTTMWMGNIVIVWILVHLLTLGWRLNRIQQSQPGEVDQNEVAEILNDNVNKGRWEIAGVVFMLTVPLLIGLTPFFIDDDMYGISGLWCWIRTISQYCGDLDNTPLLVVMLFFYAPLIVIVFFSLLAMSVTMFLVCYGAVRRHGTVTVIVNKHQRRMKEIMLVLAYPMLYLSVCLLLLANRIYSIARPGEPPYLPLWMTHTVADPVRIMLPAIAFLLHPFVWRDLCKRRKEDDSNTIMPNEPSENGNLNGDDSVENKLLAGGENGATNYGACEDDKYLSAVVDQKY